MKTLSIKNPWAYLCALGIKGIENRTWKTNFRGTFLIHVSGQIYPFFKGNNLAFTPEQWQDINKVIDLKKPGEKEKFFTTSAIIGQVDLVDCVMNHDSIWAEQSPFCPITGRRFFMRIENENGEMVNTYGGPYDSYTIPVPDETCKGEYITSRYCHDSGMWVADETVNKLVGIPKTRKPTWNWVLENAILYPKPILNVKGKLSFWEYDIDKCHCCGKNEAQTEIFECEICGELMCSDCQAPYNQFSQIDYNCCTTCYND